jgi:hypothetical protein
MEYILETIRAITQGEKEFIKSAHEIYLQPTCIFVSDEGRFCQRQRDYQHINKTPAKVRICLAPLHFI